jgi:ABC-type polysaccharide/polyol phosphate transport system ATPase subunit
VSDIAVRVENVHKDYKLYHSPAVGPIKDLLFPWTRAHNSKIFPAVKNVSFEVRRGEIVGIIGPNGAGKTTLLKMIAGLLPVDGGRIEVNGTITALLALGVGVHPEFSGRDNILYGAMLLGVPKATVLARMDEIVAFADIGPFIDQPFRTYSSGMKARLLFAISMSISPDILIVDEALATGDAQFLSKSRQKILELCNSGATILFVSHNLIQVEEICTRGIFIAGGQILYDGSTREAISRYSRWALEKVGALLPQADPTETEYPLQRGNGDVWLKSLQLIDNQGRAKAVFESGERVTIRMALRSRHRGAESARVWVGFMNPDTMEWVAELGSTADSLYSSGVEVSLIDGEAEQDIELEPLLLQYGEFSFWIEIKSKEDQTLYAEYTNICRFLVGGRFQAVTLFTAKFWHPYRVERAAMRKI